MNELKLMKYQVEVLKADNSYLKGRLSYLQKELMDLVSDRTQKKPIKFLMVNFFGVLGI